MNELKHIHFLCWQHIYSGEFTFSAHVRDGSQNCLQKLHPILLPVLSGVRWITINRCESLKAVLERLHLPLHSAPCPGRLICVSCIQTLWLSGSLSISSKGKHYRKFEGKEENELRAVAAFPFLPASHSTSQQQLPPFIPFRSTEYKSPSIPCWFPIIIYTSFVNTVDP